MTNKKTMKTIVFSLVLAAMTLTATSLNAQNRNGGGLFGMGETPDNVDNGTRGVLNVNGTRGALNVSGNVEGGISNFGIGEDENAPIGSGIVIMLAAGLGYVAFKKKED